MSRISLPSGFNRFLSPADKCLFVICASDIVSSANFHRMPSSRTVCVLFIMTAAALTSFRKGGSATQMSTVPHRFFGILSGSSRS